MPENATRILIADSHVGWRTAISTRFSQVGFAALGAADGTEAVRILATEPVDVVLIETNLPVWSGLEICEYVRSLPQRWDMPVFVVEDQVSLSRPNSMHVISGPIGGNYFVSRSRNMQQMVEVVRRALAESPRSGHSQLLDTVLL